MDRLVSESSTAEQKVYIHEGTELSLEEILGRVARKRAHEILAETVLEQNNEN
jgi:hypothetical protein